MACITIVPAVVIFSMLGGVRGHNGAEVKANDNSEQFALLCRIYNVAKNPPIHHVHLQNPNRILNEIDALNTSFANETQINETEQMENSSDAPVKPTITRETAVAQAILRRITQKAHNILEEIKKVNATIHIEMAKADFDQVIFGEGMNESDIDQGVLSGIHGRADACGNPATLTKGNHAGKSLVVDFFCLCAMTTDKNGIGNVCGVEVGGKSKGNDHGWSDAAPSGSASMWASIKKECGKLLHKHPKTTVEGQEVIEDFLIHLASGGVCRWGDTRGVRGSTQKEGMLGTGAGTEGSGGKDVVCDGNRGYTGNQGRTGKPPGGVCVYYGPENWDDNIPWLKKLKAALNTVDDLNNKTATIQRDIEKLRMLLQRAEQIHETRQVISEFQHPAVPTNLQTAAKRLTAYSAARRHHQYAHFILLFVLL